MSTSVEHHFEAFSDFFTLVSRLDSRTIYNGCHEQELDLVSYEIKKMNRKWLQLLANIILFTML